MAQEHSIHEKHPHKHSVACGHTKIKHDDHIDYVHNGHLHHEHNGHWDECTIPVSETNPVECVPMNCGCSHDSDCGHELVPHGDHMDYLVNGRLHHVHGDHCDDHGPVELVSVQ
ncbi:unnamed protein product [Halalkalibacter wakoensis JCM 9140]|uniref:Unnamed protein product n=1 Tax=Halalkalibacter wakoensis JCM 9140 TaxID=1236970 RepID=W4PYU9_9BACI|nr:hypothetical protein [Halalkalibacter wakoensis]GAE24658.1 unnamed protein product [Halalkalibacter wakoensis JCM 9140]